MLSQAVLPKERAILLFSKMISSPMKNSACSPLQHFLDSFFNLPQEAWDKVTDFH